jgi:hypothetical protein
MVISFVPPPALRDFDFWFGKVDMSLFGGFLLLPLFACIVLSPLLSSPCSRLLFFGYFLRTKATKLSSLSIFQLSFDWTKRSIFPENYRSRSIWSHCIVLLITGTNVVISLWNAIFGIEEFLFMFKRTVPSISTLQTIVCAPFS